MVSYEPRQTDTWRSMSSHISHAVSHHTATRWRLGYDETGHIFPHKHHTPATSGMAEYTANVQRGTLAFFCWTQYADRMLIEEAFNNISIYIYSFSPRVTKLKSRPASIRRWIKHRHLMKTYLQNRAKNLFESGVNTCICDVTGTLVPTTGWRLVDDSCQKLEERCGSNEKGDAAATSKPQNYISLSFAMPL